MPQAPLMLSVSGMRGIVGESLTPEVAGRFARAFAEYLCEVRAVERPRVVLARDGRAGGEPIKAGAATGLRAGGCEVTDIDVAMTPTVGVVVDHFGADGGMTATASHNPQQWNGLKAILPVSSGGGTVQGAGAANADAAAWIIERFHSLQSVGAVFDAPAESTRETGATRLHVDRVLHAIGPETIERIRNRAFPVVIDSANASGVEGARAIMQRLDCTLTHIGGEPTGIFPHTPEPTRENLTGLADEVRRRGAAAGFAQDPDADRLAIVDERGEYIGEEYTLVLGAMALFELGLADAAGGEVTLCANLSTSRMIDDVAARYGATVARTPVGEANVVAEMLRAREGGVFGGEGNGGVIWPRITLIRDSLSAMALTLGLMAKTGRTISELVAQTPAYAIVKRKVDLARREDAGTAAEAVAAHWRDHAIDRQDGVRIDFDSTSSYGAAWIHVRASNTEPIMRLIAEAATEDGAKAILDEAARIVGA